MAIEYKLSYTAQEIDEKLGKIDNLVSTINGISPDANGNVDIASGGNAIIDVIELPTENISNNCFYRLLSAYFVYHQVDQREYDLHCYCVDTLPSVGEPVTTNMQDMIAYYSVADNDAYGYITDALGSQAGVPAGWYTLATLAPLFNVAWGGIITDIFDDPCDSAIRLLLNQDYYIYQNGWTKVSLVGEEMPEFDIQWDGVIGDRFALDVSSLGYPNTYFVKISDDVFTTEQLVGATIYTSENYVKEVTADIIDTTTYPGTINLDEYVMIVYSSDDLNTALGLPSGYLTNGTYFNLVVDSVYTTRLISHYKIQKIDEKYLPKLHAVATSGSYNDLSDQPTIYTDVIRYTYQYLSSAYQATARTNIDVYSKSEVNNKITEAISGAIGGTY